MADPHSSEPHLPASGRATGAAHGNPDRHSHWRRVGHDGALRVLEHASPSGWTLRSTCLPLRTGGLVVVDPFADMDERDHHGLEAVGRPEVLLLTSAANPRGARAFCHRHPRVQVAAPPAAVLGLRRHLPGKVDEPKHLEALLPEGVTLLAPAGVGRRETWVQVRTTFGTAWIVGQAFLDLEHVPSDLRGMALGILGLRSGLTIPPIFRRFHVQDPGAYRSWLFARIRDFRPVLLVPPRGRVVEDPNLPARLKALAESIA